MDIDKIVESSYSAAKRAKVDSSDESLRLTTVTLLFNIQALLVGIANKLEGLGKEEER